MAELFEYFQTPKTYKQTDQTLFSKHKKENTIMKTQKKLKIVLSLIVTFAMLVVSLPMTVAAAGNVCNIGETHYASVKAAVTAAKDGDVINVYADTKETAAMTIDKKIELTSSNASEIQIPSSNSKLFRIGTGLTEDATPGELIVSGNLVINSKAIDTVCVYYGTFTMKDEAHCKTNKGFFISTEIADNTKNPAHINILGGTMESTAEKADQATIFFGGRGSTLNISGGTLTQKFDGSYAIKMCGENATVNITDGHLSAVSNPIAVYGAFVNKVINISGGVVEADESGIFKTYSRCDYLTINISDKALLRAKKNTVSLTSPMSEINVTGGTIIATEDTPINMGYGTLNISGGKFILEGTSKKCHLLKSYYDESTPFPAFINITGGLFINKNENNPHVMNDAYDGALPINFESGTVLYKDGASSIIKNRIIANKAAKAIYDGEEYYIYTRGPEAEDDSTATMNEGADVRLVEGSNGLRFTAEITERTAKSFSDRATYGMLIVPTQYLVGLESFTVEALTEKYGASNFLNIACTEGKGLVKNSDGSISYQAAIVNIKDENRATYFSAIAYVCEDGEYYYSSFDMSANSASLKSAAKAALGDENATYTDAEKAVLNGFAS